MNTSHLPSSGPEMDMVDQANTTGSDSAITPVEARVTPALDGPLFDLPRPQAIALECLISGGSIGDAARSAGVCRQTVSRWINGDPGFKEAYESWREQINAIASARLLALAESAVDNLSTAIRQGHDVKASQFLVKHLASQRRGIE